MANQDQNLNFGWHNQKLGASGNGQSGFAQLAAAPAEPASLSAALGATSGASAAPAPTVVAEVLTNTGYAASPALISVGAVTAPTVPVSGSGIALNPSGLNASVVVATGAGVTVTQVAIAPANSSTFQNLNVTIAASSSGAFQVPGGGQVKITYAGGTPTWAWTAVN